MVFNSDRPIYIQLAEDFKYKIACGSISLGEQLPSTTELTRAYNINQNTVLQAYELLKKTRAECYEKRCWDFCCE